MPIQDQEPTETTVIFDTKLVVILRDDVPVWQKLNATLFLVSGIAATNPATVGEPYEDASGGRYLPMFRQPGLVFEASAADLRRAFERAMQRGVELAVFTDELFTTGHDAANRAAVNAVKSRNSHSWESPSAPTAKSRTRSSKASSSILNLRSTPP